MHGRPTTQNADTPQISADRPNIWSVGKRKGRWLYATAGGFQGWLTSLFPPSEAQNTSPWCKTKHRIGKLRDSEARCAAEASENSKRTQTWMITERSNGDVQVLRTVKNGVSIVVQKLKICLFHSSHFGMMDFFFCFFFESSFALVT
ncbi:hypothetical protein CsSME_00045324 [Camellia sinensis var. sinensis]